MENKERSIEIEKISFRPSALFVSRFLFSVFLFVFLFSPAAFAQDYPKEIRGYKVYEAKIKIVNRADETDAKDKSEAFAEIGEPKITNVSLGGVTIEIAPQIESANQSGAVDFLVFKDFRVGNFAVEAEEYRTPFSFKKNQKIALPAPIKIRLKTTNAVRGALSTGGEVKTNADEWTVTGTIFVFGRFKKLGFNFKRVVPVEINLKIKNPFG